MTDASLGMDRALVARSISKRFGPVQALDDVEIVVRPGTVHALVGENGAGKSTLAKVIAGIERADAGAMTIGGAAYDPRDRADAKARGINMVPQQLSLVGELSLVENLLLVGASPLARRSRARALLAETMERAGVSVDLDAPTSALSQAHRQLGEIVVALAEGAQTLILDEPTASLGPLEVGGLFDHLRALCGLGTAIVLITHRLEEVRQVADDVTVLSHGRDVHHGSAVGLDPDRIARLMVGELPAPAPRAPRRPGDVAVRATGLTAASTRDSDLDDVSLEVRSGEVVGLAGVAGSGQNLLMDVLSGVVRPRSGTVELLGRDRTGDAVGALGDGVAWIPEERSEAVVPTMTIGENLAVYGNAVRRASGSRSERRDRMRAEDATAVLREFDVRPAQPGLMATGLSGGNQQKLLAARELGDTWPAPRVVLAYGPTQGLDLRASQAIRERLVALAEDGAAVLVASHDLEELLGVADRILVMFGGRIVADVPIADATTERLGGAMAGVASPGAPAS